jgi:hypothetical protein
MAVFSSYLICLRGNIVNYSLHTHTWLNLEKRNKDKVNTFVQLRDRQWNTIVYCLILVTVP